MIAYELAQLGLSGTAIELSCTVTGEAKPALAELQQLTGAKVRCIGWHYGDEVQWLVERCQGKEVYSMWWLLRHLCARGWEPYTSYTDAREGTRHLLRKACTSASADHGPEKDVSVPQHTEALQPYPSTATTPSPFASTIA